MEAEDASLTLSRDKPMDTARVTALVMQWLHENNYLNALRALEADSGTQFDPETMPVGGQLMCMLTEWNDLREFEDKSSLRQQKLDDQELLVEGKGEHAKEMKYRFKAHKANVLCVRFSSDPEQSLLATGSTDRTVRLFDWKEQRQLGEFTVHRAGVLSLDFNPKRPNLLLSSSMDSTHHVLDISQQKVVQSFTDHKKYVVRARWSPNGSMFATASYDKSVCVYREKTDGGYEQVRQIHFTANVESIEFTPDSLTLIVTVREDNYLHYINLETWKDEQINMNATGDDYVSFNAMYLSVSPDQKYLLVSTDRDRLIMFRLGTGDQVRNFYGASTDPFSQPRHAFDTTSKYVYSTSQDNRIVVWDVSHQRVVNSLKVHTALVRDIHYHPSQNLLASASFDKTVAIWGS